MASSWVFHPETRRNVLPRSPGSGGVGQVQRQEPRASQSNTHTPHTQARRPQTGAQIAWRDGRDLWRARSRGRDVCDGGGGTQWQPVSPA